MQVTCVWSDAWSKLTFIGLYNNEWNYIYKQHDSYCYENFLTKKYLKCSIIGIRFKDKKMTSQLNISSTNMGKVCLFHHKTNESFFHFSQNEIIKK